MVIGALIRKKLTGGAQFRVSGPGAAVVRTASLRGSRTVPNMATASCYRDNFPSARLPLNGLSLPAHPGSTTAHQETTP